MSESQSVAVATLRMWSARDGRHGTRLMFWCPGCDEVYPGTGLHSVEIDPEGPEPRWQWDGNLAAPTVSPSIMVAGPPLDDQRGILCRSGVCHSFIQAGRLEFLADCTHPMAGRTVPLPPLPDWIIQ